MGRDDIAILEGVLSEVDFGNFGGLGLLDNLLNRAFKMGRHLSMGMETRNEQGRPMGCRHKHIPINGIGQPSDQCKVSLELFQSMSDASCAAVAPAVALARNCCGRSRKAGHDLIIFIDQGALDVGFTLSSMGFHYNISATGGHVLRKELFKLQSN